MHQYLTELHRQSRAKYSALIHLLCLITFLVFSAIGAERVDDEFEIHPLHVKDRGSNTDDVLDIVKLERAPRPEKILKEYDPLISLEPSGENPFIPFIHSEIINDKQIEENPCINKIRWGVKALTGLYGSFGGAPYVVTCCKAGQGILVLCVSFAGGNIIASGAATIWAGLRIIEAFDPISEEERKILHSSKSGNIIKHIACNLLGTVACIPGTYSVYKYNEQKLLVIPGFLNNYMFSTVGYYELGNPSSLFQRFLSKFRRKDAASREADEFRDKFSKQVEDHVIPAIVTNRDARIQPFHDTPVGAPFIEDISATKGMSQVFKGDAALVNEPLAATSNETRSRTPKDAPAAGAVNQLFVDAPIVDDITAKKAKIQRFMDAPIADDTIIEEIKNQDFKDGVTILDDTAAVKKFMKDVTSIQRLKNNSEPPEKWKNGYPRITAQALSMIFPISNATVNYLLNYELTQLLVKSSVLCNFLAVIATFPGLMVDVLASYSTSSDLFDRIYNIARKRETASFISSNYPTLSLLIPFLSITLACLSVTGGWVVSQEAVQNSFLDVFYLAYLIPILVFIDNAISQSFQMRDLMHKGIHYLSRCRKGAVADTVQKVDKIEKLKTAISNSHSPILYDFMTKMKDSISNSNMPYMQSNSTTGDRLGSSISQ